MADQSGASAVCSDASIGGSTDVCGRRPGSVVDVVVVGGEGRTRGGRCGECVGRFCACSGVELPGDHASDDDQKERQRKKTATLPAAPALNPLGGCRCAFHLGRDTLGFSIRPRVRHLRDRKEEWGGIQTIASTIRCCSQWPAWRRRSVPLKEASSCAHLGRGDVGHAPCPDGGHPGEFSPVVLIRRRRSSHCGSATTPRSLISDEWSLTECE